MGRRRETKALPAGVEELRGRVERWRRTRKKRSPMPEELWEDAARLARVHGVSPIARWLGLSYYTLQGRMERVDEAAEAGAFVELDVRSLGQAGCSIEMANGEGAKLVIRGLSSGDLDLRVLAETFLGHKR